MYYLLTGPKYPKLLKYGHGSQDNKIVLYPAYTPPYILHDLITLNQTSNQKNDMDISPKRVLKIGLWLKDFVSIKLYFFSLACDFEDFDPNLSSLSNHKHILYKMQLFVQNDKS